MRADLQTVKPQIHERGGIRWNPICSFSFTYCAPCLATEIYPPRDFRTYFPISIWRVRRFADTSGLCRERSTVVNWNSLRRRSWGPPGLASSQAQAAFRVARDSDRRKGKEIRSRKIAFGRPGR